MIRKLWRSAAAVALLAVGPSVCAAEDKPILSVAVSGLQELIDDIDYLGDLGGQPGSGQQLEAMSVFFTQGHGLEGFDRKRPWGASVSAAEDGQFQVLLFVPVAKFEKLSALIATFAGEPEDAGDGVWEFAADRQSVFVKESAGWAYFSQTKESLAKLPADPVKLLGDLNGKYDIAAELHVQNLPEPLREMAIDQLRGGMEAGLQQEEGESDEQYAMRKTMAEKQIENMSQMINEIDEITIGWNVDRAGKQVYLDVAQTALPGSKVAQQLAATKTSGKPSRFTGFLAKDALFSLHAHSVLSDDDRARADETVGSLREQAKAALSNDESLGDDEKKLAEQLIEDLMELAAAQLKNGSLSVGATVSGDGPLEIVAGGAVADGALVEEKLKKWVALASQAEDFPKVKYNASEYEGVKFHTATKEIPEGVDEREKAVALLGDALEVTVGIGKDSAYLAVGAKGVDAIKKVIDAGKKPDAAAADHPMNMSLDVGKLLGVVAKVDEENGKDIAKVADSLKAAGNDHFRVESLMIENGTQTRFLLEEGVVKGLAQIGKLQQQRQLNVIEEEAEEEEGDDADDDDGDEEEDDDDDSEDEEDGDE